ncbi:MAG: hypothetical protein FJ034_05810, partial [Chloroflexi bacterium]|nr:hypothetical protein [Chloroflexota bacterium]
MSTRPVTALALLAAAGIVPALAGLPLVWDGTSFLFRALNEQRPVEGFNRLILLVLTAPPAWLARVTEDIGTLRFAYSLAVEAIPWAGVAAAWLVARERRPALFVWPMLGA